MYLVTAGNELYKNEKWFWLWTKKKKKETNMWTYGSSKVGASGHALLETAGKKIIINNYERSSAVDFFFHKI